VLPHGALSIDGWGSWRTEISPACGREDDEAYDIRRHRMSCEIRFVTFMNNEEAENRSFPITTTHSVHLMSNPSCPTFTSQRCSLDR
jgi:hypothetical protein